ncbi:MAG: tyrosine-type recombinase/integrase [Candidatus Nanopelagicales bacterium]
MKKQPQRLSFGRTRQERSGRWSAAYRHHGVMHRPADTFPSKQSAVSWLDNERHLIELDRITPGTWTAPAQRAAALAAANLTFEDYAEKWLAHRAVSRRTRDSYDYLLSLHILPVLGPAVLADITPEDVREWFAGLDATKATMRARAYGVLTAVFNTAVDDGIITRSPARITGASSVKHRRTVVLLEAEQLAHLAEKMPENLSLAVLLAGWCGLRRGEVFALTRADIGKDATTLTIDKAVTYRNREYVCGPTKTTESNRTVTVPPHLRPIIKDHLAQHTGRDRTALLFPDPDTGTFYAEGRFRVPFFAARDAIGQPDLHFHDLRHFGGVMAALTGATTREVMDRLGHTTTTAAMRYQHVAAGRADALAERLSALAGG